MKLKLIRLIVSIGVICLLVSHGTAIGEDTKSGEQVNWQVISRGGTDASSGNYHLTGTLDQTAVGPSGNGTHNLHSGFWQNFQIPFICGDANNDGGVNVSDCVWMLNFIFIPGSPPPNPMESGEVNCDGTFNVSDVVWLLNYIFILGSPAPCDC